jgi:hypothetical protein
VGLRNFKAGSVLVELLIAYGVPAPEPSVVKTVDPPIRGPPVVNAPKHLGDERPPVLRKVNEDKVIGCNHTEPGESEVAKCITVN